MRIALLSDIHEDIASLEKAFQKIGKNNCDKIACLGDITGFSKNFTHGKNRNAKACLDLIREKCSIIIAGNHDLLSAMKIPTNNPGFVYPENWYQLDYQQQLQIAAQKVWLYEDEDANSNLSESDLEYLKTLPEYETLDTEPGSILFSHYAFPNLTGSMRGFYDSALAFSEHLEWMKNKHCSLSFMGHHHPDGIIRVTRKQIQFKRFRTKIKLDTNSAIVLPPLVKHKVANRFCIFDTASNKLEIKRI